MSSKTSVRAAVRDAQREEKRVRKLADGQPLVGASSIDSFVNLAQKLGLGADNGLSGGSYGFNPITRIRVLLEWIHRGSWLGGVAVDLIAEDMVRKGVEITSKMKPQDVQKIQHAVKAAAFWQKTAEVIKWSRLYGGAIGVMLVDGQDMRTPLRPETVGKGQFKGILPLDRWQVEPSLEDLVTDFGPHLGLPKYYRVQDNAPALRGLAVHHSRVAFRLEGIKLPYQQRLTENLWGISVLERLYDRMVAFDSATMGAAQLVFKAYLRTLKIEGFRQIVASGGAPLDGFMRYVEMMRRYQGQEGITVIDSTDEFEVQQTSAFSGIGDVILQLGQQLSGATQIPLVRMFGQSPAGLNSTGESDLRNYEGMIHQRQEDDIGEGVMTSYKLFAQSEGVRLPDDFGIHFPSLYDPTDDEKAKAAKDTTDAVLSASEAGIIGRRTVLLELREQSRRTGVFTNIDDATIEAADDEVAPPLSESLLDQAGNAFNGTDAPPGADGKKPGEEDAATGPDGEEGKVVSGSRRRVDL